MPRRRRRRSRRRRGSDRLSIGQKAAVACGLVVAVAVLFLFGRYVVFAPGPPERDPDTGCPETGPSSLTAIMIDATDRIGAISRADVLARLDEYVAASREDEMVIGFEARPVGEEIDDPLLMVCHPGDPEKASEWTQNPRRIRQRLEERFRQPLEALFRDLLGREEAPTSPLMESVQSVAVSFLGREEYVDIPKRLVLVSDLMQHSEYLSFFRQPVEYDAFARSHGADALGTDLGGTTVDILFVQREAHRRLRSTRGLAEFWGRWIEDQGGMVRSVVSIDGMN
ncbi:MAG: hypothetical protein F4112_03000 [Holophagales bacterium]|nr:hypothetical protein [Holophagales bacterium]MYD21881.1 hypothetical protein [Holophagales bacterium]MYI31922.1 hypothetical protein [Holophagales bacterium]